MIDYEKGLIGSKKRLYLLSTLGPLRKIMGYRTKRVGTLIPIIER